VTVGPGIAPDLLTPIGFITETGRALAGSRLAPPTAGGEFRPALKTCAGTMPAGTL
jgi:hypothetical protein